jgi:hypothetical protein
MPKIRVLTSMVSPSVSHAPGDIIEVDAAEAGRLIQAGFAEPIDSPITVSVHTATADMKEVHTTSHPKVKKR